MARPMRLTETNLLGKLAHPDAASLADIFTPRQFARRQIIFAPQAEENLVFVVASGRVRIFLTDGDKELTLTVLKPGDIYSTHTRAWVQAYKDSTIWVADARAFANQISAHPELTHAMVRVLGDMLKKSFSIIISQTFRDVRRRLREFLRHEARKCGLPREDGVLLDLGLTVEQLASILGSTRQTVSTALNELVRDGVLCKAGRGSYLIPDMTRLDDVDDPAK